VTSLVNPQQVVQPWPTIMAASFLTTLPLIATFLLLQRQLIGGIVLSGMK
jgi:ABC-type glycerol-3-phosphate transport system permease component